MTGIEWTDEVWNPTTGCDRVSPGCDHCYALTMAKRLKGMGQAKYQNDGAPRTSGTGFGLTIHPDTLDLPLHWRKPRKIFVNSMSDLFHNEVPDRFIARVFAAMAACPQHSFQVLTKRHARMRSVLNDKLWWQYTFASACRDRGIDYASAATWIRDVACLPNVWLGVSVEDQRWADIRIPALLETPASVRFVSAEPLLGPIRLHRGHGHCPTHDFTGGFCSGPCPDLITPDWLIIGGESGGGARPMAEEWARSLLADCQAAAITPFVKQLGAVLGREYGAGPHGDDIDRFPAHLQHRQFPSTREAVEA